MEDTRHDRKESRRVSNREAQKRSREKKKAEADSLEEELQRLRLENESFRQEKVTQNVGLFPAIWKELTRALGSLTGPSAPDPEYATCILKNVEAFTMEYPGWAMKCIQELQFSIVPLSHVVIVVNLFRSLYAHIFPNDCGARDTELGQVSPEVAAILKEYISEMPLKNEDYVRAASEWHRTMLENMIAHEKATRRLIDLITELDDLTQAMKDQRLGMWAGVYSKNLVSYHGPRQRALWFQALDEMMKEPHASNTLGPRVAQKVATLDLRQKEAATESQNKTFSVPDCLAKFVFPTGTRPPIFHVNDLAHALVRNPKSFVDRGIVIGHRPIIGPRITVLDGGGDDSDSLLAQPLSQRPRRHRPIKAASEATSGQLVTSTGMDMDMLHTMGPYNPSSIGLDPSPFHVTNPLTLPSTSTSSNISHLGQYANLGSLQLQGSIDPLQSYHSPTSMTHLTPFMSPMHNSPSTHTLNPSFSQPSSTPQLPSVQTHDIPLQLMQQALLNSLLQQNSSSTLQQHQHDNTHQSIPHSHWSQNALHENLPPQTNNSSILTQGVQSGFMQNLPLQANNSIPLLYGLLQNNVNMPIQTSNTPFIQGSQGAVIQNLPLQTCNTPFIQGLQNNVDMPIQTRNTPFIQGTQQSVIQNLPLQTSNTPSFIYGLNMPIHTTPLANGIQPSLLHSVAQPIINTLPYTPLTSALDIKSLMQNTSTIHSASHITQLQQLLQQLHQQQQQQQQQTPSLLFQRNQSNVRMSWTKDSANNTLLPSLQTSSLDSGETDIILSSFLSQHTNSTPPHPTIAPGITAQTTGVTHEDFPIILTDTFTDHPLSANSNFSPSLPTSLHSDEPADTLSAFLSHHTNNTPPHPHSNTALADPARSHWSQPGVTQQDFPTIQTDLPLDSLMGDSGDALFDLPTLSDTYGATPDSGLSALTPDASPPISSSQAKDVFQENDNEIDLDSILQQVFQGN